MRECIGEKAEKKKQEKDANNAYETIDDINT